MVRLSSIVTKEVLQRCIEEGKKAGKDTTGLEEELKNFGTLDERFLYEVGQNIIIPSDLEAFVKDTTGYKDNGLHFMETKILDRYSINGIPGYLVEDSGYNRLWWVPEKVPVYFEKLLSEFPNYKSSSKDESLYASIFGSLPHRPMIAGSKN